MWNELARICSDPAIIAVAAGVGIVSLLLTANLVVLAIIARRMARVSLYTHFHYRLAVDVYRRTVLGQSNPPHGDLRAAPHDFPIGLPRDGSKP